MKSKGFTNGPYKGFKPPKRRMRFESHKTKHARLRRNQEWYEANPPDADGHWYCYISKHPNCPKVLTEVTITLEHDLSKTRRPDLRDDITNIYPACTFDNKAKGSKSAEEYLRD